MNLPPLNPCPSCGHPGRIVPAIKRGLFVAECSEQIDCPKWPMTDPKTSEAEAAEAWNRGELGEYEHPAADAE
jgi:hypothetical protein